MSEDRRLDLWTRRLAGETLAAADARELLAAMEADPELCDDLIDDERLDGMLRAVRGSDTDGDDFVRQCSERISAESDATRFIDRFKARLDRSPRMPASRNAGGPLLLGGEPGKRTTRRRLGPPRRARQPQIEAPRFAPLAWAAAALAVLVLAVLFPGAEPETRRKAAPLAKAAPALRVEPARAIVEEPRPAAPAPTAEVVIARPVREESPVAPPAPLPAPEAPAAVAAPPAPVPTSVEAPIAATLEQADAETFVVDAERKTPAKSGQALLEGQGLETSGGAVVVYADKTRLDLGPRTLIRAIHEKRASSGKRVLLEQGTLACSVTKQGSLPMLVTTPQAEVKVVGTAFKVLLSPAATRVDVSEGTVLLKRSRDGREVSLTKGLFAVASADADFAARKLEKGRQIRWDFSRDAEGWQTDAEGIEEHAVAGGSWNARCKPEGDCFLRNTALKIDASLYKVVVVRLRNETSARRAKLVVINAEEGYDRADGKIQKDFPILPRSAATTYVIDLASFPAWKGTIVELRLDFVAQNRSAGVVGIDWISVCSPEAVPDLVGGSR